MSKKKVRWLIVYGVVAFVCIFVLWTVYAYYSGLIKLGPYPLVFVRFGEMVKEGDNYTTIIMRTIPPHKCLPPANIEWYVSERGAKIAAGPFPLHEGVAGSVTNNNITVTWFDSDNDKFLSEGDGIKIVCLNRSVADGLFVLIFSKPDEGIYDPIGSVSFPSQEMW
ncbi:MAG: hypothetical protein AB1485_02985 [Candidatus Thermoplasmatota archaeon]